MPCSLLTMGCGNVLILKETIKAFSHICDEIVYGDLLLFTEDREILKSYQSEFNLKIVPFKFDYLFHNGFSSLLNTLADNASNDVVMYLNTSEVIDEDYGAAEAIADNPECNVFYFTHRQESHRWFRIYNRHELKWSGMLHEQLEGEYKPFHRPIFMMADKEKDMQDPWKAKIFNDVKELVYFQQYNNIVDYPERLGETDPGWVKFATDDYESMKNRLIKKGKRYQAFKDGDLEAYMKDIMTNPEFQNEKFQSDNLIAFQGDKIHLL